MIQIYINYFYLQILSSIMSFENYTTTEVSETTTNVTNLTDSEYAYAASLKRILDNPNYWIELYADIFAESFKKLGLSENATIALTFFTLFTFVTLGLVILGGYNTYCINKTRKSQKKYYSNLQDGLELSMRAMSPDQHANANDES